MKILKNLLAIMFTVAMACTAFGQNAGSVPQGPLMLSSDGYFYGTNSTGGKNGGGTVFRFNLAGTFQVIYSFSGGDGSSPQGVIQGNDGNLYGTTRTGGSSNQGTVYQLTKSGSLITLVSFNGSNGSGPQAGVIQANDGNLYGTTTSGGSSNQGTVYQLTTSGSLSILASFSGSNGSNPYAGVIQASDGNLYGTTYNGGSSNYGTVYKITTSGALTSLFSFNGTFSNPSNLNPTGGGPIGGVVENSSGNLIGTVSWGSYNQYNIWDGGSFTLSKSGTLVSHGGFLNSNSANNGTGGDPQASPLIASNGLIYQTCTGDGISNNGTVTTGSQTDFFTGGNGSRPNATLIDGGNGNIYGMTPSGGASGGGTIFSISITVRYPNLTTLYVLPLTPPTIFTQPSAQTVTVPTQTSFSVVTGGPTTGPFQFQWQRLPSGSSSWGNLTNSGSYTGATTTTLTVTPTSLSMSGDQFRCVVSNTIGAVTSNPASLTVLPLQITAQPSSEDTQSGGSLAFSITAAGSGPFSYQWQWAPAGTSTWSNLTDGGNYSGSTTASLAVSNVTQAMNNTQLRCIVTNTYGSVTSNAATLVIDPPDVGMPAMPPLALAVFGVLLFLFGKRVLAEKGYSKPSG